MSSTTIRFQVAYSEKVGIRKSRVGYVKSQCTGNEHRNFWQMYKQLSTPQTMRGTLKGTVRPAPPAGLPARSNVKPA